MDLMLKNIEKGFTSDDFNATNLEEGKNEIIEYKKFKVTLTTSQNQKNNTKNNETSIDLGICETLLRSEYNSSDNETLFMKKIDIIQEGMRIPKIEFDVYAKLSGSNLVKLNLTICEDSKMSLSVPVEISENLDKLNMSSDYFNDLCYKASSEGGTDIILNDRKN